VVVVMMMMMMVMMDVYCFWSGKTLR
jgi:hypothetical protein